MSQEELYKRVTTVAHGDEWFHFTKVKGLHEEVQVLCTDLMGDAPISFEFDNNGPDMWKCDMCAASVPVIYIHSTGRSAGFGSLFTPTEPCDITAFPHREWCPVLKARHILKLLGGKPAEEIAHEEVSL